MKTVRSVWNAVAIITFATITAIMGLLMIVGAGVIGLIKEQWGIRNDK